MLAFILPRSLSRLALQLFQNCDAFILDIFALYWANECISAHEYNWQFLSGDNLPMSEQNP